MKPHSHPIDAARRQWLQRSATTLLAAALPAAVPANARAPTASGAGAVPIRLDLNESAFGPSPMVAAAIAQALSQLPRYVGSEQAMALQRQIAAIEGVSAEQVVLGEVLEALGQHLALNAAGGDFIYSVPGYDALVRAAAPFAGRAVAVPLDAKLGNDLPALMAAISADTRALFVVNPHNPSGTLSARDQFDAFMQAAARRTLLIVDEAYLDYCDDAAERSAVRLLRAGQQVVVFRTLGKLHALAGLQIGYALAPRPLADALRQRGVGVAAGLNQLSIAAAAASLADPSYLAGVRRRVADERARWQALLARWQLPHSAAAASFVFFDAGRPQAALAAALDARGIRIGRGYPSHPHWARISIGLPAENAQAQAALRAVLGVSG